ncbi:acylphosphatase [Salibacteraceae bacterium]|nr:acylphosphatase [Salibacteraceae bacterium]
MKIHWKISVIGEVQGVWFRKSAQHEARKLGLTGFVKNEKDGSVYIEVEGTESAVSEFIAWCSHGPELANVQSVNMIKGEHQEFKSFDIA